MSTRELLAGRPDHDLSSEPPIPLLELLREYEGCEQQPVVYSPSRWALGTSGVLDVETSLAWLEDESCTSRVGDDRRAIDRMQLTAIASIGSLDDRRLLQAFLLTLAWGNGMKTRWGIRNAAIAFADRSRLVDALRYSSEALRGLQELDEATIQAVAKQWDVPGIAQSFYSKWFAMSSHVDGRAWQPLILDMRVARTVEKTLGTPLSALAGSRRGHPRAYAGYLRTLHDWARDDRIDVSASQLEWILFSKNGQRLSGV